MSASCRAWPWNIIQQMITNRIAISDFLGNKMPNLLLRVKEQRKCLQLKKELQILNSKMIEYGMIWMLHNRRPNSQFKWREGASWVFKFFSEFLNFKWCLSQIPNHTSPQRDVCYRSSIAFLDSAALDSFEFSKAFCILSFSLVEMF